MDKRNITRIAIGSLAALIAVAASFFIFDGCSSGKDKSEQSNETEASSRVFFDDNYINALPAGPLALVNLSPDSIIKESALLQNEQLMSVYKTYKVLLPEELQKNADMFISNPSSCGIDVEKPIYAGIYNSDEPYAVVAVSLADRDRFLEVLMSVLKELDYNVVEQNDGLCYVVDENGERLKEFAFDGKALLIAPENDVLELAPEGGSKLASNPVFVDFIATGSDMGFSLDMGVLFEENKEYLPDAMLNADVETFVKELRLAAYLDFTKGGAALLTDIQLQSKYNALLGLIKGGTGKHFSYMPSGSVGILNFYLDLNALYSMLPEITKVENITERVDNLLKLAGFDNSLLNTLSTEFTIALLPKEQVGRYYAPRFVFAMDCSDKTVFDKFVKMMELQMSESNGTALYKLGMNSYSANGGTEMTAGCDYLVFYKDEMVFVMPEDIYENDFQSQNSQTVPAWFNEFKGKEACFDLNRLAELGIKEDREMQELKSRLGLQAFTVDFEDISSIRFGLHSKDKESNLLKVIADEVVRTSLEMFPF